MKKKNLNYLVLFIALSLVLYFSLKDNFYDIIKTLLNVNLIVILVAFFCYLLYLFFKGVALYVFTRKTNENITFRFCMLLTFETQFFNGITPLQLGGKPYEIYRFKKNNVGVGVATNLVIKEFISYQFALVTIETLALLFNSIFKFYKIPKYAIGILVISYIINLMSLVMLFVLSNKKCKNKISKIIKKIIKYFNKLKIFRKLNLDDEKVNRTLNDFSNKGKLFREDKFNFSASIVFNIISLILFYSIPYFILIALGSNTVPYFVSVLIINFVLMIGNIIPIPGSIGGMEYTFVKFFEIYITSGTILSLTMLLWRFITYILGLIVGFITLLIDKGDDYV